MKSNLDSQTVYTGRDDLMTMTVTVFEKGEQIIGTKKYIRHQPHESKVPSGTCSPNGVIGNGRPNSLKKRKDDASRKHSAPF